MERARTLLLLLVLVPGAVLLTLGVPGEKVRPSGDVAGAATPDHRDDGDSAPFMVMVEHGDGSRCAGSLVSARTVITSSLCSRRELNSLWVRAQPGPARRVLRLVVSTGSAVNLALLELEISLGPPARAILIASVSAECAPPAACHVVCARSRRLRIVDEQLVPADACAALIPHSLDEALCLTGAPLCPSDSGAGVVCAGKLCGVIGNSDLDDSPADTGCGSPRVAAALPRHRRFLQCAHRPAACTRDAECKHICTETQLLDEESVPAAGPSPALERHSPPAPPLSPRAIYTTGLPPRTSSAAGDTSWVVLSAESAVPASSSRGPGVPATRTAPAIAPSRSSGTAPGPDVPSPADTRTRSALEFEPNRADFKPGEYGDNAAEYAAEEPLTPARTSAAAAPPQPPTRASAPAAPGIAAAELAVQVSPAETLPARASCGALWPPALVLVPVSVPVVLLLALTL